MANLKSGDLVRLKSDRPTMSVEEIAGTSITCVSFHNDEAKYNAFKADTLQPHVPRASVPSSLPERAQG
jgi:uncharacterized protein YodC (DUF2158 family)